MLLSATIAGWQSAERRYQGLQEELHGVASTLSIAVGPTLAGKEYSEVQNILRAIGRIPKVTYAHVVDLNGELIAAFGNGIVLERDAGLIASEEPAGLVRLLTVKTYPVDVDVVQGGRQVGRLMLIADVSELRGVLAESFGFAMLWSLFAALAGVLIAVRLEKSLSGPILDLTSAMREIRESHNFSRKVERTSNDETGDLVDAFNEMLSEIQTRDAALARHRETLEQTVDDRTRDLREATMAAQKANAAKSDFLATMSHEIRTPMNGMLAMAELLTTAGLPTKLQRYADVIASSGKSLLSIINDILDFSKIEAGRLELEAIPVDPRKIVDEVTRLFAERAASKGIDLAGYVEADVPRLLAADPVRLNQILSNLVNNALKFTKTGGVAVRVLCDGPAIAENYVKLRFEVVDTGIGIEQEKLATIFEVFSQADQSTTRQFGGTGIGLAICKRLSRAMGGDILVTSTYGKGSKFTVTSQFEVLQPALDVHGKVSAEETELCRNILIAMEPGPTRSALEEYAASYGFLAVFPPDTADPDWQTKTLAIAANVSSALTKCCALNGMLRENDADIKLISLTGFGKSCKSGSVSSGEADAELGWPLVCEEVEQFFMALRMGSLETVYASRATDMKSRTFATFPGVRVLAADDSAINREVLGEALARLGVDVVNVADGTQAVEAVQFDHFDLIFMDGSMPQMDGFEATRKIRKWERECGSQPVPIVALTAHVVGSQADLWRDAGMNDCVTKPFTLAMLEKTLQTWLPHRKAAAEGQVLAVSQTGEAGEVLSNGAQPEGEVACRIELGQRGAQGSCDDSTDSKATNLAEVPLVDDSVLQSIREMQTAEMDLVSRIIGLYHKHAREGLSTLRQVWNDSGDHEVASAAHALKSLSRNIGALRVGNICDEIEEQARKHSLDRSQGQLGRLSLALKATLAKLPLRAEGDETAAASADRR